MEQTDRGQRRWGNRMKGDEGASQRTYMPDPRAHMAGWERPGGKMGTSVIVSTVKIKTYTRHRNVSLHLGADDNLINKGSLGCTTGKHCLGISYGLSEITRVFVRSQKKTS